MTTSLATTHRHVRVARAEAPAHVQVAGDGPPLVFPHGADGAAWAPGLSALTERFTVLFSFSDRPVLDAFGLWREEAAAGPGADGLQA